MTRDLNRRLASLEARERDAESRRLEARDRAADRAHLISTIVEAVDAIHEASRQATDAARMVAATTLKARVLGLMGDDQRPAGDDIPILDTADLSNDELDVLEIVVTRLNEERAAG
ncbi:MAG: hypothetical protein GC201_16325 [Alphaproteobacteria bacterium]|nr:hypothetical protein [Alphaproteobacteria bacterium]